MSGNESPEFSSLPPLPKRNLPLLRGNCHSVNCNGENKMEVVEEKVTTKEIFVANEANNMANFEKSESHTMNEKAENNGKIKSENDLTSEQHEIKYIDEDLSSEIEMLKLNNEPQVQSIQDGGSIGNVPKFSAFGLSRTRPFMNSAVRPDAENYKMDNSKRGHCLIFNNSEFESQTQLNARSGTNQDRDALNSLFTQLGFEVHVFDNLKLSSLHSKLYEYACGTDHQNCDCLVVFFLSHGEENMLYATDYSFDAQKLFINFTADNCRSLASKPKMFFVQACRGSGVDDGVVLYHNGRDQTDYASPSFYKIPVHADFLICYSTIGAHFSWRNTINGSWFIQSIVKVFRERAAYDDVLSMMTSVNRRMIIDFESNCPSSPDMHSKKQTACINSTLMRKIYLRPPQ